VGDPGGGVVVDAVVGAAPVAGGLVLGAESVAGAVALLEPGTCEVSFATGGASVLGVVCEEFELDDEDSEDPLPSLGEGEAGGAGVGAAGVDGSAADPPAFDGPFDCWAFEAPAPLFTGAASGVGAGPFAPAVEEAFELLP